MQTDLIKNNLVEMNSLLSGSNNTNENEPLSHANRSKNSSETILIERDYKNINGEASAGVGPNLRSSLLIDESSNQLQTSNVDVAIVQPKKSKQKKSPASPIINSVQVPPPPEQFANSTESNEENIEELEDELVLKYGAQHVIKLFIPVTICLLFVIISLSLITSYQKSGGATLLYTPFNEESQQSSGTKLWMSIANASIFICVVVVMTVVLILLYKFRCYKIIHAWLAFSSLMLLFFFTYMFIGELFKQFNVVTDMITVMVLLWNFGIVGMACIHWKGPLILQQIFLIFSCVQMALIFIKYLPEWTTWVLLAFISIWDLIAVLCPFGPLRILVETARSRNDSLFPAMVYSSAVMYTIMANIDSSLAANKEESKSPKTKAQAPTVTTATGQNEDEDGGFEDDETRHLPSSKKQTSRVVGAKPPGERGLNGYVGNNRAEVVRHRHGGNANHQPSSANNNAAFEHIQSLESQQEDEQENGVKLGLGDFIFYSILVGKASILGDWNTVIACFLAILIGLCFTLVLLAIYHKPLPALPISLLFGLLFYFLTNLIVRPFYDNLTYRQFFI